MTSQPLCWDLDRSCNPIHVPRSSLGGFWTEALPLSHTLNPIHFVLRQSLQAAQADLKALSILP